MSSAWVTLGLVAVLAAMHALLQKELPAYTLLLSLGAIVLLLVRLGGTFRSVLEGVALLGQQTDKQAFQCLLRSTGILLLADYTRTLCKESGAEALGWCAGLAGRCLVLAAVFPLLEEVCQRIWGLAGGAATKTGGFWQGWCFWPQCLLERCGLSHWKACPAGNCGSPT